MATHLIVYGHGAGDPGAVGNGENERDFNRKKLHIYLKKWADKSKDSFAFFDTSGSRDMFQETANGWGMYSIKSSQYKSVTEIHEDAASASATGGHVIVSSSFSADKEDLNLAQAIKKIVGWWGGVSNSKGISYRNNLLNLNVAAQRGITYRLMELGFITSKRDMDTIKRDLDKYAKEIIENITGETLGESTSNKCTIIKGQSKPGGGLWLSGHVSNKGWLGFVGSEVTCGSTGCNLPLEAVDVRWNGSQDYIRSSFRDLKGNWTEVPKGITGTTGKAQAIDLVCFKENDEIKKSGRTLQYRVHSQDVGWSSWKSDGRGCGTKGKKIEAIQMRMLKNGKVEKG